MAKKKIAIVGAGAVGCYAGAHMVQAGEDVTYIDPWPENVEAIRNEGLRVTHIRDIEPFTVKPRALHLTEAQQLAKEAPIDIAFVCMKSYDTAWATALIKQYLAPGGYVVSLQNCMNEETIAGIVGWGKTLGSIASSITVELHAPGQVRRAAGKSGARHTVFRVGEVECAWLDREWLDVADMGDPQTLVADGLDILRPRIDVRHILPGLYHMSPGIAPDGSRADDRYLLLRHHVFSL